MKRGTIVLSLFPFTDLTASKRRPVVIVSVDSPSNNDFIVAFISSVVPYDLEPTDLLFSRKHKDFKRSGLKRDSVIKLSKLATLNLSILSGEIGSVSKETLNEIDKRLKLALGLS